MSENGRNFGKKLSKYNGESKENKIHKMRQSSQAIAAKRL